MTPASRRLQLRCVHPDTGRGVPGVIVRARSPRGGSVRNTTGPGGWCALRGAGDGPTVVEVVDPAWAGTAVFAEGVTGMELRLERAAPLSVRVVDELGWPFEGAEVRWWASAGSRRALTDASGRCAWGGAGAGAGTLAIARSPAAPWATLRELDLAQGAPQEVEVALSRATGTLICRVRGERGGSAEGAVLRLAPADEGTYGTAESAVDAHGEALFSGLERGWYAIFTSAGPRARPLATVHVDGRPVARGVRVPERRDLVVRATGPDGAPTPGVVVRATDLDTGEVVAARADAEGRATFPRWPCVRTSLETRWLRGPRARFEHDGATRHLSAWRDRTLVVVGRAPDLEGAPVTAVVRSGGEEPWRSGGRDRVTFGRLRVRLSLPAGLACALVLRVGGRMPRVIELPADGDRLDLGELTLDRGVTVRGRLVGAGDAPGEAAVEVVCPELGRIPAELRPDGTFSVTGVPHRPVWLEAVVWSADGKRERRARRAVEPRLSVTELGDVVLRTRLRPPEP